MGTAWWIVTIGEWKDDKQNEYVMVFPEFPPALIDLISNPPPDSIRGVCRVAPKLSELKARILALLAKIKSK